MSDIMEEPKGRVITLSDGKDYTLAPFTLNTLATMEEEFDCDLEQLQEKLGGRTASAFRRLLWVLLHETHPELTKDQVGKLVRLDKMGEIMAELTAAIESLKI